MENHIWALKPHQSCLTLKTSHNAVGFYQKCGYTAQGNDFVMIAGQKIDTLIMTKLL
jgi:hypothetical protein